MENTEAISQVSVSFKKPLLVYRNAFENWGDKTPPIRSELSRQFPRAPGPVPWLAVRGLCLDSQRGLHPVQLYLALTRSLHCRSLSPAMSSLIFLIVGRSPQKSVAHAPIRNSLAGFMKIFGRGKSGRGVHSVEWELLRLLEAFMVSRELPRPYEPL